MAPALNVTVGYLDSPYFILDLWPTPSTLSTPFTLPQAFHALRQVDEAAYIDLLYKSLRPGGLLMILTGNANEPEAGPSVLSEEVSIGRGPAGVPHFDIKILLGRLRLPSCILECSQPQTSPSLYESIFSVTPPLS